MSRNDPPRAAESSASPDRPLRALAEDRLGYARFAKMLATSVLRGCPADGLVIGVCGAWGLGKTSLLNFIEHEVNADPDAEPPYLLSGIPLCASILGS